MAVRFLTLVASVAVLVACTPSSPNPIEIDAADMIIFGGPIYTGLDLSLIHI